MTTIAPERLDRESGGEIRSRILDRLRAGDREVVVDLSGVRHVDSFGAAALVDGCLAARKRGARFRVAGSPEPVRRFFATLQLDRVIAAGAAAPPRPGWLERLGDLGLRVFDDGVRLALLHLSGLSLTFLGPFRKRGPRADHFFHQLAAVGTGSVGIVVLISFIMGLIMALQAAYQLRQFGANIFVADLVGVAMTRELGPLLTAIILASRSGSSMAAELGTMVVTEEVDALRVMAIDPRRFLVAPRFAALSLALPCLVVLSDAAGIFGGMAVGVFGLNLGVAHYWHETVQALYLSDIATGLVKAFVFGNVIAVVACHRGLSIRGGPEAVGRATTWALVTSIVVVIFADLLFTTFFYLVD